jgi:colanic acid/amylovoran biosynthesis protein
MPRILLQDSTDHHRIGFEFNRGAAAILVSTIETIGRLLPDAQFVTFVQLSDSFAACQGIRVVKNKRSSTRQFSLTESVKSWWLFLRCALWAVLHKYLRMNIASLVNNGRLKEYHQADIVLDLSMDHYNNDRSVIEVAEISRDIFLGVLLGKPVVIYAQSPGPFNGWLASHIAKFTLNRVSLVTLRENISRRLLDELGIIKPVVRVTADPAFLLEPPLDKRTTEILSELGLHGNHAPLIGIGTPEGELWGGTNDWRGRKRLMRSAFHLLEYLLSERLFLSLMKLVKGSKNYSTMQAQHSGKTAATIADLADHLVEKLGVSVLLVPHFVPPRSDVEGEDNGLVVADAIHRIVSNKDKVIPVIGDFTAREVKGVIGKCELFISLKMHPAIAATSQCVPTIVIGSHHKFPGIMQMLGQRRWALDRIPGDSALRAQIDEAWSRRTEIRRDLETRMPAIRDAAMQNALLVREILESARE